MKARALVVALAVALAASCAHAQETKQAAPATAGATTTAPAAADTAKAAEQPMVTVTMKDGSTVELKSVQVGTEGSGLFGTSFTMLRRLPVKAGKLHMDVPMDKLAKIEFVESADAKVTALRLTSVDGKVMDCVVDSKDPLVWKGISPFADAEVKLDAAQVKEIVLRPVKK